MAFAAPPFAPAPPVTKRMMHWQKRDAGDQRVCHLADPRGEFLCEAKSGYGIDVDGVGDPTLSPCTCGRPRCPECVEANE